jgi:nicotinamidase-related amidase
MNVFLIIDMQVGLFDGENPRHDKDGVVKRINEVARAVRSRGGHVIFIQHNGKSGDETEQGTKGWQLLPELDRGDHDIIVTKTACDSFYESMLPQILESLKAKRLIISGCATDFCVDTTIRAAASRDFDVTVVADGHTTANKPYADAATIIIHHNWIWEGLVLPHSKVRVLTSNKIIDSL